MSCSLMHDIKNKANVINTKPKIRRANNLENGPSWHQSGGWEKVYGGEYLCDDKVNLTWSETVNEPERMREVIMKKMNYCVYNKRQRWRRLDIKSTGLQNDLGQFQRSDDSYRKQQAVIVKEDRLVVEQEWITVFTRVQHWQVPAVPHRCQV